MRGTELLARSGVVVSIGVLAASVASAAPVSQAASGAQAGGQEATVADAADARQSLAAEPKKIVRVKPDIAAPDGTNMTFFAADVRVQPPIQPERKALAKFLNRLFLGNEEEISDGISVAVAVTRKKQTPKFEVFGVTGIIFADGFEQPGPGGPSLQLLWEIDRSDRLSLSKLIALHDAANPSTGEIRNRKKHERICGTALVEGKASKAKFLKKSKSLRGLFAAQIARQACNELGIPKVLKRLGGTAGAKQPILSMVQATYGEVKKGSGGVLETKVCISGYASAGTTVDVSYTLRGNKTPLTTQKIVPPNTGKKFKFNASSNFPVDTPPTETIIDLLIRAAPKSGSSATWRESLLIVIKPGTADPLCD